MSCNKNNDRAVVVITALILIALLAMGYGVFKLVYGTKGQDCAVEVQFAGGVKATYLGTSI